MTHHASINAASNPGEGGSRTLDTGFSPYNGLANSARPLPIARNQSDMSASGTLDRTESGCSASLYAPHHAPPVETKDKPDSPSPVRDKCSLLSEYRGETSNVASAFGSGGAHTSRKEGALVRRSPEQLRPHPVLDAIGWTDIEEINDAARQKTQGVQQPILITHQGIILSGVGSWPLAVFEGRQEITCVHYDIDDNEALQYILAIHRARKPWNSFMSIRLALKLEPYFQQKALENMRAGGKYKGSTNLSKADRIEVRQEVANAAGCGVVNVDKVKAILQTGHPNIIKALQNGSLRIHRAWKWCRLPKSEQKETFAKYDEDQTRRKISREFNRPRSKTHFALSTALEALKSFAAAHPGQIEIRSSSKPNTVIVLGQDLINESNIQDVCKWF